MNLLQKRNDTGDDIIKGRFIRSVMKDTSDDINQAQEKLMTSRGFKSAEWYSGRSFSVTDNSMDMEVLKVHRFVDMKTIDAKSGKHRKKNHPVYNKIVWGHYNNAVRQLAFGFTEDIKQKLREIE